MAERSDNTPYLRAVWIIPALALFTLFLGAWGWLDYRLPLDDALYRAVGLFVADNDHYAQGVGLHDWRFRLGRWTALAVVFSTGFLALGAVLHHNLARSFARLARQAVVVVGDDQLAPAALGMARRAGRSALWLGAPVFGFPSLRSIALPWPAEEHAQSVRVHARAADHVLISHGDDAESLALARAARAAASKAFVTVLMRDTELAEEAAATVNEARTRVFSRAALAARALHLSHPPFLAARQLGHPRIHALIVGFGQTGQAIARDLMVNCRAVGLALPRLTVIDPQAGALESVLRVRAPELDDCCESCFVDGEIGSRSVRPGPVQIAEAIRAGGPITAVYVCLSEDAATLSAAVMLQSLLRSLDLSPPQIFARLGQAYLQDAAAAGAGGLDALTPFGELGAVLEASQFLCEAPDAAARAFNEAYRTGLTPAQRDDPANRSARPWDELDETYRQANRDAVAHVPAKLASAGIDPARWRGVLGLPRLGSGERLYANEAELEVLAELEHERWQAQRRMDGWRRGEGPSKDEARRLHPSLVPYCQLTDDIKEFDRAYVRQTAAACGEAD
jgi:hypothetical protein